jgi:predicted RNA-binding Zn-ribbon protein involved in translation (DUF1610 family)
MKPAATLKELLKPPFRREGEFIYVGLLDSENPIIGIMRTVFNNNYFEKHLEDEFHNFQEQALNEKWERDYGEPLQWMRERATCGAVFLYRCPKCLSEAGSDYAYCQSCGQRLLPPEGN